eukprot:CAMPEP_0195275460 /NCGR_PEP_ID=MMETSP0706-20130129/17865_1 /TAXON_ID=33640 /ORGANISM="Asterionellopsis glacialis, Strain CCMP134" /LENGTH=70 /DNA_ID=CAMNT_0040332739 /DNA_START=138 /DNA_END=350 /DNA_ORIENTATION=-
MAKYSNSDLRRGGQLEEIKIILDLVRRRDLTVALYPKIAFPDFITNLRREFMDSAFFLLFLLSAIVDVVS